MIARNLFCRSIRVLLAAISLGTAVFVALVANELVRRGVYLFAGLAWGLVLLLVAESFLWGAAAVQPSRERALRLLRGGATCLMVGAFSGQVADAILTPWQWEKAFFLPLGALVFGAGAYWARRKLR